MFWDDGERDDIDLEIYPPDPKTQEVKRILFNEFRENPRKVYYQRQLEVRHEKGYYHWLTDRALKELGDEEKIRVSFHQIRVGEYSDRLKIMTIYSNRYFRRAATKVAELVEEYCSPDITQDVGLFAQEMFKVAYARYGYKLVKEDVKDFNGKTWGKSKKNLDFVIEKSGRFFGCEVKNKLGYIDKDELDEKIEMCIFFGIIPIFIMRYSPTVWNDEVFKNGGFVQIFETQIFSPGRRKLVNRLKEELGLPVLSSERIPDSIMERIDNVIKKRVFEKEKCEKGKKFTGEKQ